MKTTKELTPKERIGCGVLLCVMIGTCVFVMGYEDTNHKSPPTSPKRQEAGFIILNARISLAAGNLTIKNNDSFDWTNVKLDLNSGTFKSGYVFPGPYKKIARIRAGQTHNVSLAEFTKGDGTRFNRTLTKPQKITITCKTATGEQAFYHGAW